MSHIYFDSAGNEVHVHTVEGLNSNVEDDTESPGDKLDRLVKAYMVRDAERDYEKMLHVVLKEYPELARQYAES